MSHIPAQQWLLYVDGELSAEERERSEAHLGVCDDCLELYMRCMEQLEERLPRLIDEAAFADVMMKRFDQQTVNANVNGHAIEKQSIKRKPRMPLYQHPFFHYSVAAVITLILMSSGVFQTITQQISHIEAMPVNKAEAAQNPSFSKKMLDQTIVMLDSIQPKRERGGNP